MSLSRTYQIIFLCFIALAVYYSALFAPLCALDDTKLVFYDAVGTRLCQLPSMVFFNSGYYRPLLFLTFVADNYLWMLDESFLHLENVLLHVANALLMYAVTERFAKRSGIPATKGIPFVVALLFVLHPLATESVNWISGRTDPLACLFLLFSLKILLDWFDTPTVGRMIRVQLCFFMACLAKETAVFFIGPALLLVMVIRAGSFTSAETRPSPPSWRALLSVIRTDWLINASFAVTTLAYFALRYFSAMSTTVGDRGLNKVARYVSQQTQDSLLFDKLLEVFKSIGFYARKIIVPWPLNFNIIHVSDWYALIGLAVLLLLVCFFWQRRDLVAALVLSAFLVGSSALLVSVGKLAWTPYAERYMYIPLIFFIPGSILWLYEKIGSAWDGRPFRIVMILLCGVSLITTVQRNLVWMDSASFYELNYRQAPKLDKTIKNYAVSLFREGRVDEFKRIMKLLPPKKRVAPISTSATP
jgi:hypothetical protein